jgi:tRNA-specific 2-thiouridylase
MPAKPKVLVAMSGGVDSSVAAALLQREGHEVVGVFMRLGSPGESLDEAIPAAQACAMPRGGLKIGHQGCCSLEDASDARGVAARLGAPLYVVNFKKDFGRIIDYFAQAYHAGHTPNPCVRCNDWLKFGRLFDHAAQLDCELVATGHYARCEVRQGEWSLCRGLDAAKDQSAVLFGIKRDRLAQVRFPVGALPKAETRQVAKDLGLPTFDKPDSQEICFVPDQDYAGLLGRREPGSLRPGAILDLSGHILGEHGGHQRFTIGQRKGLGVAAGEPLYVVGKDAQANTVTLGPREALAVHAIEAGEANWLVDVPSRPLRCSVQWRVHGTPESATVQAMGPDRFGVQFDAPVLAVATGQTAVLYQGDRVIGGGWIDRTERAA